MAHEEGIVNTLQNKIDEVASELKDSEERLLFIRQKLKALQDVINDPQVIKAGKTEDVITPETAPAPDAHLSVEERQARERAIRAFNLNPMKGIELVREILSEDSPHELAQFFLGTAGINKEKLGLWLGQVSDEYAPAFETLDEFAHAFRFEDASFESGLRAFCAKAQLPAEVS